MSGKLGSATYSATIREWATGRVLWQTTDPNTESITWSRERTETTTAVLTAPIRPTIAHRLEPWVHLLTIYRDDALVWHGVVTRVAASSSMAQVTAHDGSVMYSRRRVASNRTWAQHDATQVMRTMVQDALGYRDPTNLVESITALESRIWITAGWTAAECMLSDVVSDLVGQGLMWTVSAGRLLIGPVAAQHTTAQITDHAFDGELTIVKDGTEVVTDALVVGKGVWGQRAVDTPVGMIQSIEKADGLVRAQECEQLAQRIVDDAALAPRRVEVSGGSRLLPTAPITIEELIPGVRIPVSTRQTGVVIGSLMQLTKLDVAVDSGGEQVKVTLAETNVSDDVAEMPDPAELDWRSPYEKEMAAQQHTNTGSGAGIAVEDQVGVPPV